MATIASGKKKLSTHFTIDELVASHTATRRDFKEQFSPPEEIQENLKFLAINLLEKLRELNDHNPILISSGYRCSRLNEAVGGVSNSQHLLGQAVDIDFGSKKANAVFFDKIKRSNLIFDQLLNEFGFKWVHISMKKDGNRRQILNINS